MSLRNRERREQNRQRRLAGETLVKEVKADALVAAFVQEHGRDVLAAELGAASTSDEDLALAYADNTARAYADRHVDKKAFIRATYRSALAALQAAPR